MRSSCHHVYFPLERFHATLRGDRCGGPHDDEGTQQQSGWRCGRFISTGGAFWTRYGGDAARRLCAARGSEMDPKGGHHPGVRVCEGWEHGLNRGGGESNTFRRTGSCFWIRVTSPQLSLCAHRGVAYKSFSSSRGAIMREPGSAIFLFRASRLQVQHIR